MLFRNIDQVMNVSLGGHEYEVKRARLGTYIDLSNLQEEGDVVGYFTVLGLPTDTPALEALSVYADLVRFNGANTMLPMMMYQTETEKEKVPWDYPGRWCVRWIHLLANAYHWSRESILDLYVDEFFAYVQEVTVEEQFRKEWEYSLSEIAYSTDPNTHTTKFVPLKRPIWMMSGIPDPKKARRVPKALMPVGLVIGPESGLTEKSPLKKPSGFSGL